MESTKPLLRIIADEIEFAIEDSSTPQITITTANIHHFDLAVRKALHELCKVYNEADRISIKVCSVVTRPY